MVNAPAIIIMPFGLPWDWPADYERKTAEYLSRTNTVVAFLIAEGISLTRLLTNRIPLVTRSGPLYVFRPVYVLPLQRLSAVRRINFSLAKLQLYFFLRRLPAWQTGRRIYWSFSLQYAVFPRDIPGMQLAVYDCVDAFVSENPAVNRIWQGYETRILRESDVVLANSGTLFASLTHRHSRVYRVPEGLFDADLYIGETRTGQPTDLKHIPHPRITFVGNISHRTDLPLVERLAHATPAYSYIFIGPLDPGYDGRTNEPLPDAFARIRRLPNVHYLGAKPKRRIPAYIGYSDVGLIAYDSKHAFNRGSFPMKIQEYFFMGKPVLSTPLPELNRYRPYVRTFASVPAAKRALAAILSAPWKYGGKQRAMALENGIGAKLKIVSGLIGIPLS
jgi:hypothetical protein